WALRSLRVGNAFCAGAASAHRRSPLPRALPPDLDHLRGPWVWLLRLSVCHFHANPELGGLGAEPTHFVAAVGLAQVERDMDGDSIARDRGRCGNFRPRYHHISPLRHRGGFDDRELARIAQRLVARAAETVRLLGLSDLFDSIAERLCVAAEAHRLLAITGME